MLVFPLEMVKDSKRKGDESSVGFHRFRQNLKFLQSSEIRPERGEERAREIGRERQIG